MAGRHAQVPADSEEPAVGELSALLAARSGHFRLESGYHSNLWLDLEPLFLRPARLRPFAGRLAEKLARAHPEAICGPLLGGALVAQLIALELGLEFIYTERVESAAGDGLFKSRYGLPTALSSALSGRLVAVVDDAISAGSSVRATISALEAANARVVAVGALLVMGDAARDLSPECLERLPYTLWAPENCPQCTAAVPLELPG